MKKRSMINNIIDKVADVMDLPGEVIGGVPRVTVTGCRRVFIENHRGILEYGEKEIDINGGRVIIRIHGEELRLCSMNDGELLVAGTVLGLEFVQ